MNFKIIIHAIILLFILHIIIINVDCEINIGKKVENFNNQNINKINDPPKDSSLDFLLENKEKDNEFIKRMNEINNSSEKSNFTKKNTSDILPSNNYLSTENTPNFESTVEDVSKFYTQNNYSNLEDKQSKSTSLDDLSKQSSNIVTEINKIENNSAQPQEPPSAWKYNDEFAMNGGDMNGIIGFDGLESQYADFGSMLNISENNKPHNNNIPHDDLRKPIVVN